MKKLFKSLRRNESGQTATEYMLIVAVLVMVVIGAAKLFGADVSTAITGLTSRVVALLQ